MDTLVRKSIGLTFGQAIEALKEGYKVARKGWNGKDMFLVYFDGRRGAIGQTLREAKVLEKVYPVRPIMILKTAQEDLAAWSPSGSDVLAEDWEIINL